MKSKPHILYFTGQFPFPNDLSRCIFASHLARAMENWARVTVVCPVPYSPKLLSAVGGRFAQFASVPDVAVVHGQQVHYPKYLSIPKIPRTAVPQLMMRGVLNCVEDLNRQDPFDLIHCRWLFPEGVAAVSIANRLKIPSVLTAMGCDINEYIEHSSMGPVIKTALGRATALTGVSNQLTGLLSQHSGQPAKCFYTPNGVNLASFANADQTKIEARLALNWAVESKEVLFVGRLAPEKNVELLINSFSKLLADPQFANTRLWIAGSGPSAIKLNQLTQVLGVNNITFLGSVAHSELAKYLKAADVMALSSHQEGMPNAVIESLALGTPVVATAVGAIPDLVNLENGIVTPPGDIDSFAKALKLALTRDWDHHKIAAGMQRTWNDAASDYSKVYDFALSSAAGA
jgi:teichuronic acid biosynthesis glycosyltransferase TuaC